MNVRLQVAICTYIYCIHVYTLYWPDLDLIMVIYCLLYPISDRWADKEFPSPHTHTYSPSSPYSSSYTGHQHPPASPDERELGYCPLMWATLSKRSYWPLARRIQIHCRLHWIEASAKWCKVVNGGVFLPGSALTWQLIYSWWTLKRDWGRFLKGFKDAVQKPGVKSQWKICKNGYWVVYIHIY